MNKVLLKSSLNFYKANMHCHSTFSDGNLTPFELKELYKNNGYHIISITDHEHLNSHSYLDDEEFLTITGAEYAIKEFPKQSTLKNFDMKVCHLNLYAKCQDNTKEIIYNRVYDHFSKPERRKQLLNEPEFTRTYGKDGINAIIKKANDNGFFVCYNHPNWSLENYSDYIGYEDLWAVEVFNNSSFCHGIYDYNINVYDDFLRENKNMFLTFADDNHNIKADSFGGFIMVNAEKLEYDTIINALLKGNFYASTGPLIYNLEIKDNKVLINCSDADKICYTTRGRRSEIKQKKQNTPLEYAEFDIKETDGYFRITIYQNNKIANTNAYFI